MKAIGLSSMILKGKQNNGCIDIKTPQNPLIPDLSIVSMLYKIQQPIATFLRVAPITSPLQIRLVWLVL